MRSLILILSSVSALACPSHHKKLAPRNVAAAEAKKEEGKGLDVDRIECAWNKTSKEAEEKCKPDPNKPTIAQKLDKQLTKDAKTFKKFFGIKGTEEEAKKEEAKPDDAKKPE